MKHPRRARPQVKSPSVSGKSAHPRVSPNGSGHFGVFFPVIIVSNRPLRDVASDALAALVAANDPPVLFLRGGQIVRIRRDERAQPMIEPLSEHALRGRLARAATFLRLAPNGSAHHIAPPLDVTRDIAALGTWPTIPPLAGLVEAPVLRSDGTLLDRPGYDPETRFFYAPAPGFKVPPIPDHPTAENMAAARALLDEVLCDFPFDGDASRAHAFALLVTLAVRIAIPGAVPLFLIDKPSPGTGASLLCEVVARIVTGRPAAPMSPPDDDEEARKAITAALLSGSVFNVFDNADRVIAAASLARVLTADVWRDRILGRSEQVSVPQRAVWAITGNAVRIAGDLARRSVLIHLDARAPHPWKRRVFKHPRLLSWAGERRGELMGALLTLCRAWYADGCPPAEVPTVGGFEDWARIVGGILAHAGVPEFLTNRERLYEQIDEEHAGWPAFLNAIAEAFGDKPFTSRTLAKRLAESEQLHNALPERLADERDLTPRRIGDAIKRRVDVRFSEDGLRIERASSGRDGAAWRIIMGTPSGPDLLTYAHQRLQGHDAGKVPF